MPVARMRYTSACLEQQCRSSTLLVSPTTGITRLCKTRVSPTILQDATHVDGGTSIHICNGNHNRTPDILVLHTVELHS